MKQQVLNKIIFLVAEETGGNLKDLKIDTRLQDLVADSLEFTELLLVIREAMGPMPEDGTLATIGDVAEHYSKSPA